MNRKKYAAVGAAVVILLVTVLVTFSLTQVRRHRVFRPGAGEVRPVPPAGIPPVEKWSETFGALPPAELIDLLDGIEERHPDQYRAWSLAYLHARAHLENGDESAAAARLAPFLAKDHPLRDRALYHQASIAGDAEASRHRTALIFEHPDSIYRDEAIDDELELIAAQRNPDALVAFADRIAPTASTERRREIGSRIVEALVTDGELDAALTRGLALLNGGTSDDASDRVARALDKAEILARLDTAKLALFGETFQGHRHYDRAIALLQMALKRAWSDDLQFALGRSYFGAERYEDAQAAYLRGASITKNDGQKATFLWHAARSAQLRGDDAGAERLMTATIAVKGTFPATTVALTQRLRTRLKHRRNADAASDLALLRKLKPNDRASLEGALAWAVGMLAARNTRGAVSALNTVPRALLNDQDEAEFTYWRARALENRDSSAALQSYLQVLRSDAPTHFAYFVRKRLDSAAMAPKLARELKVRETEVAKLMAEKKFDLARRIQTDRVLLSSKDREKQLQILASIYRELEEYREILELSPRALPRFPLDDASPDSETLLMAMGLFDEAIPAIEQRYALRPARDALTRSYALNLGGASRQSIYAIEVMMNAVPDDFHPDLLPRVVRELLYPRYFYEHIAADAKKYDTDPALVLSIMREESRFNPRAKSQAAARGLLQFIITTARDIGRNIGLVDVAPEDLYDPRIIISLGARYISELGKQLENDRYLVTAAYNAGPKQSALWARLQAGEGEDYFLTAVNFDETKNYVRKVMNSYERYREIYGESGPAGGLQVEP